MLKKFAGIIAVFAILLIFGSAFFGLTISSINEIAGFDFRSLNEANYFKVEDYAIVDTEDEDADVQVEVTEDGVIKLSGEHKGEEALELQVATIVLEEGEYEFCANLSQIGVLNNIKKNCKLVLRDAADGEIVADEKFTVEETTTYNAYIVIEPDSKLNNVEIGPVLVEKG